MTRKRMTRKPLYLGLAALLAASLYLSPHYAAYQIRQAVQARDADRLAAYLDTPALRASFTSQFLRRLASGSEELSMFAAFGQLVAAKLTEQLVETMVTPAGMLAMLANGKPAPLPFDPSIVAGPVARAERDDVNALTVSYLDWSRVKWQNASRGPENGAFILRRENVWSWKLVAVELPQSWPY